MGRQETLNRIFSQYIRSYPPYLGAVSSMRTWGRVMPRWEGST